MLLSIRLIGDKFGVVKRGFSKSMLVPLVMLKRATRPFPLPGTVWISKSGRSNSRIVSVPDTN